MEITSSPDLNLEIRILVSVAEDGDHIIPRSYIWIRKSGTQLAPASQMVAHQYIEFMVLLCVNC